MKTIAITGAAGQIGYALLFSLAAGRMLGDNTKINLNLIELPGAMQALEGVAMELDDCSFPLLNSINITSDLDVGFNNIDWAILVGAAPRKAGMERADLLKINGGIFSAQGQAINNNAKKDAKVLVVGNPCNTNCLIAKHHAPRLNPDNFFAMTMLDQNRAYAQIAKKANIATTEISNLAIFGNHSATQFPDIENAMVTQQTLKQTIADTNWLETEFITTVQQRGAAIIKARGASSAASAANAAIETIAHIEGVRNSGSTFSVALNSKGEYGARPGLIVSYPVQYKAGQLIVLNDWQHTEWAKQKIQASFMELEEEYQQISQLGLI